MGRQWTFELVMLESNPLSPGNGQSRSATGIDLEPVGLRDLPSISMPARRATVPCMAIRPIPLPADALLAPYAGNGGYTDCYTTVLERPVTHAQFVEAFYTGGVFKLERLLLHFFLSKPSTDAQARQLAAGEVDEFSAWHVEGRATNQLLMCDIGGRTRSWLMVAPAAQGSATQLYFGSAVVPEQDRATGKRRMGVVFTALLGFHRLYSRILLGAAHWRLRRAISR